MLKLIIFLTLLVVVLRFVLRFVLPIFKISNMAQDRLKQMERQMDEMNRQARQTEAKHSTRQRPRKEDYIEYEEMK